MAFMKKDVNLGLLVLIIASIILFSGFSVYYQTTFKDVSLEYQNKLEQLGEVTKQLATQKQELNTTYSLKMKAEQDRRTLDARYKDVRDENDKLNADNTNLRLEISSTKSELGEKTAQLEVTQNLLTNVQTERDKYKAQRDSYKNKWNAVCDDYTILNSGVEHDKC